MKKSEVLKALGDYVVSYNVEEFLSEKWLVVEIKALAIYHIHRLGKYILSIDPTENKTLRVNFCCKIEID